MSIPCALRSWTHAARLVRRRGPPYRRRHLNVSCATAVSSLSMEPPMMLVCLNRTSDTQAAVLRSGVFAVNILGEDQGQVAYRFAKKGQDKFHGVGILRGQ